MRFSREHGCKDLERAERRAAEIYLEETALRTTRRNALVFLPQVSAPEEPAVVEAPHGARGLIASLRARVAQKPIVVAKVETTSTGLALRSDFDDAEPRVRDLDLAEFLGMKEVHHIRALIQRNEESLGIMPTVGEKSKDPLGRGRPGTARYLTEAQALFVTVKSETAKAVSMTKQIIAVFLAARRGTLAPVDPDVALVTSDPTGFAMVKGYASIEARSPLTRPSMVRFSDQL